jgi:hypothetical protein
VHVVLGAGGDHERAAGAPRRLDRGPDPLGGKHRVVDRGVVVPAEVLHGAAGKPGLGREANRLRHALRLVRERVLEVG